MSGYPERWRGWWRGLTPAGRWGPLAAAGIYQALHVAAGGWRPDHLFLGLALVALHLAGPAVRPLYRLAAPFLLMIALYDSQGYYARALRGGVVHVREPHELELQWFGVATPAGPVTPAHWWQGHTHPALDLLAGGAYLLFAPVFLATAAWHGLVLPRRRPAEADAIRRRAERMMWALLVLVVSGCAMYYWYPAAPPWYVDQYGLGPARFDVPGNPAGGARFDALLGVTVFHDYYSRAPNIFGAIPSLHVAYPLLALFYAWRQRSLVLPCAAYFLLVGFAAVYLNHHYVVDLLGGAAYALAAGGLVEGMAAGRRPRDG